MKDNISIIFTAIIGTFLIVILPLYSILDRQDSMSYNVVLTETTKFVDDIRNNGFLDKDTYYNYISALASTANTYKVNIEAYKKTLIRETDNEGNIIQDSYVEEIELYNTNDILRVLEGETKADVNESNRKNNVYLFDENDEIYVRVYNTNITTGSMLYSMIAGNTNTQVINVSYGGVINKVNWELYHKIQAETTTIPEVIIEVPTNANGSTNIQLIKEDNDLEGIDCSSEDLSAEEKAICEDVNLSMAGNTYTYYYDLSKEENKTINIAVELKNFDKILTGRDSEDNEIFTKLDELTERDFENVAEYLIQNNYIQLNGMFANVDLKFRKDSEYYFFNIVLKNVRMSSLDYLTSLASVTILPGIGQDVNEVLSLGADSVQLELTDVTSVNEITISNPHNWNKFIRTKNLSDAAILNGRVYVDQDIFFLIEYTGINNHTPEEIKEAIRENFRVHIAELDYENLEIYTAQEINEKYQINIMSTSTGRVIVKFKYNSANMNKENYVQLLDQWITTNIEEIEEYEGELDDYYLAKGVKSSEYQVLLDDVGPIGPTIVLDGDKGKNGWYISDVELTLENAQVDRIKQSSIIQNSEEESIIVEAVIIGGSGVNKSTLKLEGADTREEFEVNGVIKLTTDGITEAYVKAHDYCDNESETINKQIKIDKTGPTAPKVILSGEEGLNGWYTSEVKVEIIPGTDATSGIEKTTYKIDGANEIAENEGNIYTLTKEGQSTLIATTYDKAGNKTETAVEINIDTTIPAEATITVVSGEKNSTDNHWYKSDVTLRFELSDNNAASGLGTSSYRITGTKDAEVPMTQFEGSTKEITLTQNGVHNITVYTYTLAGNLKSVEYTVQIDKDAPNEPSIIVLSGTKGSNEWYTSDVELQIITNGDVGPSNESLLTYTITKKGDIEGTEVEIHNGSKIFLNTEGEYEVKVYSRDNALNISQATKTIKIDKTNPISADFVVNGTKGKDDWYVSDVNISYKGEQDSISGINKVELSTNAITSNTNGTKVILTTTDNAGRSVTNEIIIKLDKSEPTNPIINIKTDTTGTGAFGVQMYNTSIDVTITPGEDYFLEDQDNLDKTTCEVLKTDNNEIIISETEGYEFALTHEGRMTIIARTYDKAGNVSTAVTNVWIDKSVPATPEIVSINDIDVKGSYNKVITSKSNIIKLETNNLVEGYEVKVILTNEGTYQKQEIDMVATADGILQIPLSEKGTYRIQVTQTNRFGTTSKPSGGIYSYIYE